MQEAMWSPEVAVLLKLEHYNSTILPKCFINACVSAYLRCIKVGAHLVYKRSFRPSFPPLIKGDTLKQPCKEKNGLLFCPMACHFLVNGKGERG